LYDTRYFEKSKLAAEVNLEKSAFASLWKKLLDRIWCTYNLLLSTMIYLVWAQKCNDAIFYGLWGLSFCFMFAFSSKLLGTYLVEGKAAIYERLTKQQSLLSLRK